MRLAMHVPSKNRLAAVRKEKGKSTISMAIFNSYVKLPEVSFKCANVFHSQPCDDDAPIHQLLIDPTPGVIDLYKFIESI